MPISWEDAAAHVQSAEQNPRYQQALAYVAELEPLMVSFAQAVEGAGKWPTTDASDYDPRQVPTAIRTGNFPLVSRGFSLYPDGTWVVHDLITSDKHTDMLVKFVPGQRPQFIRPLVAAATAADVQQTVDHPQFDLFMDAMAKVRQWLPYELAGYLITHGIPIPKNDPADDAELHAANRARIREADASLAEALRAKLDEFDKACCDAADLLTDSGVWPTHAGKDVLSGGAVEYQPDGWRLGGVFLSPEGVLLAKRRVPGELGSPAAYDYEPILFDPGRLRPHFEGAGEELGRGEYHWLGWSDRGGARIEVHDDQSDTILEANDWLVNHVDRLLHGRQGKRGQSTGRQ